jgi:protein-L-isoaspartate(D-aspartate) O-methyltransferase
LNDASSASESIRRDHVRSCIEGRGISAPRVLEVMRRIPRELFVDSHVPLQVVYGDHPLSIACGQTISQPYMVAWMTDELRLEPGDRVLEVGTGSGYQTAILASLVDRVYTMEYHAPLSKQAQERLRSLSLVNVQYRTGDGSLGWPEAAPFDKICVTAGAPGIPAALKEQMAEGGIMVLPTGSRMIQDLVRVMRLGHYYQVDSLGKCRFVELRGQQGWDGSPAGDRNEENA